MRGVRNGDRDYGRRRLTSPSFWARAAALAALLGASAILVRSSFALRYDANDAVRTAFVGAEVDTFVIEPVGDRLEFATKEIRAKSGTQITIVMNNTASNPAMHHNVAVLRLDVDNEDGIAEVGSAAVQAGEEHDYIPDHDAVLAATPMAAPGERTETTFTVPEPGSYPYVCLYPGHYVAMRGVLVSTP